MVQSLRAQQSVVDKLRAEAAKSVSGGDKPKGGIAPNTVREQRPCRDFTANGYCSWGDACRYSHTEGATQRKRDGSGQQRTGSKGGSKGGSQKGKGSKGDREGTKREREGGEKTGASFHRITYTGPGTFQYSPSTRSFSYSECQRCLVERFNWKPRDCEGMCFECGADQDGGTGKCPTPTKDGHQRQDSWAHKFPQGYAKRAAFDATHGVVTR